MVVVDNCDICELQRATLHGVNQREHEVEANVVFHVLYGYDDNLQRE